MIDQTGAVLGVDIGCSAQRRSSAICRLSWTADVATWDIARFRAVAPERQQVIAATAGGSRISAAAFDGPLAPGLQPIGRYRTAERMLTRRLGRIIGKPGQSSAPVGRLLNEHANACAQSVLDQTDMAPARHATAIDNRAIVEAFPGAFLGMLLADPAALGAKRSNRSDIFFQHLAAAGVFQQLLQHCLPGRAMALDPAAIRNHDDRAALVCAMTALCVVAGDFVAVGDDDGWIILPPRRLIQPTQWRLLEQNALEEAGGALRVYGDADGV